MTEPTIGYWIDSPGRGSLRDVLLAQRQEGDVLLEALCSGISVGTERLIGRGNAQVACSEAMACRGMQGSFELPLLYGYSFVGRIADGPDAGRRAFVMRPHQQRAIASRDELHWLPNGMPDARATLFPNMETARNAVWDAELTGTERVAVIGAGAVGLLVAYVLSREHDGQFTVIESDPDRRAGAAKLPWVHSVVAPEDTPRNQFAHTFHTSGTSDGLQLAIDALGFEGQVNELSWFGDQLVALDLGSSFHHQRKRIAATQVGTIAKNHREAGYKARAQAVLQLLADPNLDALLGDPIPFADLPRAFNAIYDGQPAALCPVVGY